MKKPRTVTVYACKTDWDHEMGEVADFTPVYSSVKALKRQRSCVQECGIVELSVSFSAVIKPDVLDGEDR